MKNSYQVVVGLEVHVQLDTERKLFGTEAFQFGDSPNTAVSIITLAHPGTLPSLNPKCIEHAVRLGLAMNCHIRQHNFFARKNYFYPDLPKGFQTTQDTHPICYEGFLDIRLKKGEKYRIGIERIHLEEDAGKSIHDQHPTQTCIDLNRAGTPLTEIVSRPDIRSAEQAMAYVAEIRRLVRYVGVSDANMEEGNLRCDVNVSVMKEGAEEFGTRVEVKNVNSISNVGKVIEYERDRQIRLLENGGEVMQETRTWLAEKGRSAAMRDKETADDYRYFPEPDLLPVVITDAELAKYQQSLPELPAKKWHRYVHELGIPQAEADVLIEQREFAEYFDELSKLSSPKESSNWLLGTIRSYLNEQSLDISQFPLTAQSIAQLIQLVQKQQVSHTAAKEQLFPAMIQSPQQHPLKLAQALDLMMESQSNELESAMKELMEKHPAEVKRYQNGKKGLAGFFVGQLMRQFKGKANPKEVNQVVRKLLNV